MNAPSALDTLGAMKIRGTYYQPSVMVPALVVAVGATLTGGLEFGLAWVAVVWAAEELDNYF